MIVEARIRLTSEGQGKMELLRTVLLHAGIPLEKMAEKNEKGKLTLSLFLSSAREARVAAEAVRSLRLKGISLSLVPLYDRDWKTRWKKYFKPFSITRDIRIIPVWEKESSAPAGARGIRIDTTSAFGTGLHATTRIMAGFIRERKGRLDSFLDVGTGSGILSLIACSYGARDIWAMDNDPQAVKTAGKNFRTNRCRASRLFTGDFAAFRPGRRFDFVAANLFTEDLVRFRRSLGALVKPGGSLAVSGIFFENYPSLRRRFRVPGLRLVKAVRKDKWYGVLFAKKERRG
jgi:ribosomal protein L11 methyltransferase